MSDLVAFLEGAGHDGAGRHMSEVLAFGLGSLEARHDFVQWLFPLTSRSHAAPDAPVLTALDVEHLRASRVAQTNLVAGCAMMTRFYSVTDHWLKPNNHNHLRITRIIKSQRLLVGGPAADAFRRRILACVVTANAQIGATTLEFWRAA